MSKAIYFDMDGTIADLYGIDGWEDFLIDSETFPYEVARPMYDMDYLNALMAEFIMMDWTIGVITWTAMNGSAEYNKAVRAAKREWLDEWMPCVTEFHCVKYGTTKHGTANIKHGILVDDNAKVREGWNGRTVDATQDIIDQLEAILAEIQEG